jgi:DUF4097 and DUF4098 domain-containing protein YvlB
MPSIKPRVLVALALSASVSAPMETRAQERTTESVFSEQFDVGPGGTLRVDVPDGDVTVDTWSGDGVEVEVLLSSRDMEWATEMYERMEFTAGVEGSTVRVTARDPRIQRSEWGRNRGFSVAVHIKVPQRFDADIRTSDGDIRLGDLNGSLWLDTSDGDIDLGRIQGSEVEIETSDGDVTAVGLLVERTTIRTSDGDIAVESATGALQATTGDGDIDVQVDAVGGVRLRTGDGDITLYVPATLAATVDLDGEDLDVARSFAITGRISRRRVRGDINGGGVRLEASTGDGSISLRQSRAR